MAGFFRRPREQPWRGWVFQVHLWTGLLIGVWALLMGATGSALVFKDEIEAWAEPELFTVAAGAERASLDAVAGRVAERFPEYEILNFRGLDREDRSHIVRLGRLEAGELVDQWHVHYDPYSGEILGAYSREAGVWGWLEQFHYYLLLGKRGMQVNGVFGAALVMMCATGLAVWWPGSAAWREGLRVKLRAGWKRRNYDLHRAGGFYAAAFLALMAFTGFYFGFPSVVEAMLRPLGGPGSRTVNDFFAAPPSGEPEGRARASLDAAVRSEALPQGAVLYRVVLPLAEDGAITVVGVRPGNPLFRGYAGAHFDQYSGELLSRFDSRREPPATRIGLMMAPLHFGEWGGVWSKALWLVLGLVPGGLFLTGFLMWWNRVARRRYRTWKAAEAVTRVA